METVKSAVFVDKCRAEVQALSSSDEIDRWLNNTLQELCPRDSQLGIRDRIHSAIAFFAALVVGFLAMCAQFWHACDQFDRHRNLMLKRFETFQWILIKIPEWGMNICIVGLAFAIVPLIGLLLAGQWDLLKMSLQVLALAGLTLCAVAFLSILLFMASCVIHSRAEWFL